MNLSTARPHLAVDQLLALDETRRTAITEFETLRALEKKHLQQLV